MKATSLLSDHSPAWGSPPPEKSFRWGDQGANFVLGKDFFAILGYFRQIVPKSRIVMSVLPGMTRHGGFRDFTRGGIKTTMGGATGRHGMSSRALAVLALLAPMGFCHAETWPVSSPVEAQPLIAQALRVAKALEMAGQPLGEQGNQALARLRETEGDGHVTGVVEKVLDPRCVAAVEIGAEGVVKVIPHATPPGLVEQGWRVCLVKVVNKAGSTGTLRVESPSALPVPKGPQSEVQGRWLDLAPLTAQPLLPKLGGLRLEYTALQIYSRDAGDKAAEMVFSVDAGKGSKAGIKSKANFTFVASASHPVTFRVTEFDGSPATAAFIIRDSAGRVYPSQSKRLAPDFFFHPQVYRSTGETVRLPSGRYTVVCSRGPESIPETRELVVDGRPAEFRYSVSRWIDPARKGWWSGDHHIHAAGCQHYDKPTEGVEPADMMRHILGEDLKVGCCLTWGPCFDYQKRFFTGKPDNVSRPPYILRYDVEVSGFGSHSSGHLNLLGLKEQIPPGGLSKDHWPTLGMNTLRWAKRQGAICGPAHSANGLTRHAGRIDGAKDGPGGLPNFNIPAFDGIGANEYIVQAACEVPGPAGNPVPAVDFISTMDTDRVAEWNMWYHTMNCGFRVRASGETDFPCISGERVGMGRVYVKVPGPLEFDSWLKGIAEGRSYVSDGTAHLMDFRAETGKGRILEVGESGSEIRLDTPGALSFDVTAAIRQKGKGSVPVELIVNGLPVMAVEVPADGNEKKIRFRHDFKGSAWVAVRAGLSAHTNPFFVTVQGKAIRADANSARWCLAGVDQCWKMKAKTYKAEEKAQAEADYAKAREIYAKILSECTAPTPKP